MVSEAVSMCGAVLSRRTRRSITDVEVLLGRALDGLSGEEGEDARGGDVRHGRDLVAGRSDTFPRGSLTARSKSSQQGSWTRSKWPSPV